MKTLQASRSHKTLIEPTEVKCINATAQGGTLLGNFQDLSKVLLTPKDRQHVQVRKERYLKLISPLVSITFGPALQQLINRAKKVRNRKP